MIWFTPRNEFEVREYQNHGIIIAILCYNDSREQKKLLFVTSCLIIDNTYSL